MLGNKRKNMPIPPSMVNVLTGAITGITFNKFLHFCVKNPPVELQKDLMWLRDVHGIGRKRRERRPATVEEIDDFFKWLEP